MLNGCVVGASSSEAVPTSGFFTSSAKIIFPTEIYDRGGYYDNTTGEFTVPHDGLYEFKASVTFSTSAANVRTRMGVAYDRSSSITTAFYNTHRSEGTSDETYIVDAVVSLNQGDKVFLMISTDGGATNLSGSTSQNIWSIKSIQQV